MSQIVDTTDGLSRLLDPLAECFSPEVARKVAELQADAAVQARVDELAAKANEGQLTDAEEAEYDAYIRAMDVVAVLQKKARQVSQPGADGCPDASSRTLAGWQPL